MSRAMTTEQALETVAATERRSILGRNRVRGPIGAYKSAACFNPEPFDDTAQVERRNEDARLGSERLLERIQRLQERRVRK